MNSSPGLRHRVVRTESMTLSGCLCEKILPRLSKHLNFQPVSYSCEARAPSVQARAAPSCTSPRTEAGLLSGYIVSAQFRPHRPLGFGALG